MAKRRKDRKIPYTETLILHYQTEMKKYGIRLNVFASKSAGREFAGAKGVQEACEGDIEMAKKVITLFLTDDWARTNTPSLTACARNAIELIVKVQAQEIEEKPIDYTWVRKPHTPNKEWKR